MAKHVWESRTVEPRTQVKLKRLFTRLCKAGFSPAESKRGAVYALERFRQGSWGGDSYGDGPAGFRFPGGPPMDVPGVVPYLKRGRMTWKTDARLRGVYDRLVPR